MQASVKAFYTFQSLISDVSIFQAISFSTLVVVWERYPKREMDRMYWLELGQFQPGEEVVSQQAGLRLYDGEDRVSMGG